MAAESTCGCGGRYSPGDASAHAGGRKTDFDNCYINKNK